VHGTSVSKFNYSPLININIGIGHFKNNINTAYFYYPAEFGWRINNAGNYSLTKTPINVLTGKKLNDEWNVTSWNTNGDWVSQTCQFEVTEEQSNEADSISSANKYDRFLVLLEKIE
jgi:hypothetical protein